MTLPGVDSIKPGQLTVDLDGALWGCCCAAHAEEPFATYQADEEGRIPVRPPGRDFLVLWKHEDEVAPEDVDLRNEPMRRPSGATVRTGDPAPGFQPDCLACEDAAHGLIDHMARVRADRDQAARIQARIARHAQRAAQ